MNHRLRRRAIARLALVLLAATPHGLQGQDDAPRWRLVPPDALTVTGRLADRALAEASGAAPSWRNPGLIWTIGDSGNPPDLLAVDSTGALRGVVHLEGIPNTDWEEVAVGPCGTATCVYIADVGDNAERRAEVVIHRLVEPQVAGGEQVVGSDRITSLRFHYADRPHDAEAMAITPDGAVLIVTKGRSGGIFLFTLPATAWQQPQPATAALLDTLPITPNQGTGRLVTGMAISADGGRVQIRTYRELFLFERHPDGRLTPANWTSCDILGKEPQGEAVGWLDGWRTILLSERGLFAAGTVIVVECRPRN